MPRQPLEIYNWLSRRLFRLCSMQGRVGQLEFALRLLALLTWTPLLLVLIALANGQHLLNPPPLATLLAQLQIALTLAGAFWILMASIVQRLHDLGRSGRYGLIGLIGLPVLLWLPGQPHMNRFGLRPSRTRSGSTQAGGG